MAESARPGRERKAVESFVIEVKEKKEFTITAGAGTKLGDIENIKVKMDKLPAASEELKSMHRMCYGRPGEKNSIKKNLREFSGLTIEGIELTRKEDAVKKLDGKLLKQLLTLCDLSTGGTKADNQERFIGFLKEPAESGKKSLVVKAGEKRARVDKKKAKAAKGKGKKGKGKAKPELKRPMSSFMLYCQNKRDKVKDENPEAGFAARAPPLEPSRPSPHAAPPVARSRGARCTRAAPARRLAARSPLCPGVRRRSRRFSARSGRGSRPSARPSTRRRPKS